MGGAGSLEVCNIGKGGSLMVCNQIRLSSCWRIARLKIMATLTNGSGRHKSAQDELAYEYLCRLQEAKT